MSSKGVKAKRRVLAEPESRVDFLPVLVAKTNATATEHKPAEAPRRVGIAYGEREKTAPRTARRQGKRNFNALLGLPTNYLQVEPRNGTHSNTTGRSYNSTVLPVLDRPRLSNQNGSMPTFSKVLQKAHSENSQFKTSLVMTHGATRSTSRTGATFSGVKSSLTTPVQLHHHQQQQQQIHQVPQPQSQHEVAFHGENLGNDVIEGSGSLADPHLLGSTWNDNGDVDMGSEEELLSNRVAIEVERRRRQEPDFVVGQKTSQSQTLSTLPASLSPSTVVLPAIGAEESSADASRSPAEPCSDDIAAEGIRALHGETGTISEVPLDRVNECLGGEFRWRTAATDLDSLGSRNGLTSGSPGGLLGRGVDFPVVPWSPVPSRAAGDDFVTNAMSASATASAAASAASTAPGSFDSTAAAIGDGADDIGALGMSRLGTASSYGGRLGSSRGTFSSSSSSSMQSGGMLSSRNSPGLLFDGYAWELPEAGTGHVLVGEDATDIGSDTVGDDWALREQAWGNSMGYDGEGDSMLPLLMLDPGGGNNSGIGDSGESGYGSTPSDQFPSSPEDALYSAALPSGEGLDGSDERQVQWSAGPTSEARLNAMQSLDLSSASLQENPFEAYNNAEEVVVSDAVGDLSAENVRAFNSTPSSMLNVDVIDSGFPSMSEETEFQLHEPDKLHEPDQDGDGSYGTLSSRSSINENDNGGDLNYSNNDASYYSSPAFTQLDLATRCEVARSAAQRASTAARKEAQVGAQEAVKARAADAAAARARAAWVEAQAVASRAQVQRLRLAAAAVAAVDRNSSEVARARAAAAAAAAAEVQEAEVMRKTAAAERKTAAAVKLALVRAKQGGRPSATKAKSNKAKQEALLDSEQSQQREVGADKPISEGTNSDPWLTKQPLFSDAAPSKKVGSEKNPAKQLQSLVVATAAATALNSVVKQKRVEDDTKAKEAGEWRRTALWRPRLEQQQHADGMAAAAITKAQELKAAKLQMRAVHQAAEQKAAAAAAELANARAAVEAAEVEAQQAEQALQVLAAADAAAARAKKRAARRVQRQEAKQRLAEESALTAADQDALAASRWAAAQRLKEQAAFESACAAETAHARDQEMWSHENLMVLSDELDFAERYTLRKEVERQEAVADAAAVDARLSEEEEAAMDALEAASKVEDAARQAHVLAAQKAEDEAEAAAKAQRVAQEATASAVKSTNEATEAVLAAQAAQALATVLATSDSIEANHTAAQRVESTKTNQDNMRAQASTVADAARTHQLNAEQAAEKEVEARAALAHAEGLRAEQAAKLAKVRALQRARAVAALAATQAADDAASAESPAERTSDQISQDADLRENATKNKSDTVVVTEGIIEDKVQKVFDDDLKKLMIYNVDHARLIVEQRRADEKDLVEQDELSSATEQELEPDTAFNRTHEGEPHPDADLEKSEVQVQDHTSLSIHQTGADEEHRVEHEELSTAMELELEVGMLNGGTAEVSLHKDEHLGKYDIQDEDRVKLNSYQAEAGKEHSVLQNEPQSAEATDEATDNRVDIRPECAKSDVNFEYMAQMPIDSVTACTTRREEFRSGDSSGSSGDVSDGAIDGGAEEEHGTDVPSADTAMNRNEDVEASLVDTTTISSEDQTVAALYDVVDNDAVGTLVENISEEPKVKVEEPPAGGAETLTADEATSAVEVDEASLQDTDSVGAREVPTSEEPKLRNEKLAGSNDQQAHVGEQLKAKTVNTETACDGVSGEDAIDNATHEVPGFVGTGAQASTEVAATTPTDSVANSTSDVLGSDRSAGSRERTHEDNEAVYNESVATLAGGTDAVESNAAKASEKGAETSEKAGDVADRLSSEPNNQVADLVRLNREQSRDDKQPKAMDTLGGDAPTLDSASGNIEDDAEPLSVQIEVASSDHGGTMMDRYTSGEPSDAVEDFGVVNVKPPENYEEQRATGMELSNEAASNADVNDGATIDGSHLAELGSEDFIEVSAMMYIDSVVAQTISDPDNNGSGTNDDVRESFDIERGTDGTETAFDGNPEPVEPLDSLLTGTEAIDATLRKSLAPERPASENEEERAEALNDTHDTEAMAMTFEPADVSPSKDLQQPVPSSPESYPSTGLYYERYMFLPAPTPDHVEVTDGAGFECDDGDGSIGHGSSSGGKKSSKNKSKNKIKAQEFDNGSASDSNTHDDSSSFTSSSSSSTQEGNTKNSTRIEQEAGNVNSSRNAQETMCDDSFGTSTQTGSDTLNSNILSEAEPHRQVNSSAAVEAKERRLESEGESKQSVHATARNGEALPDSEASCVVHGMIGNSPTIASRQIVTSTGTGARPADFVGDKRDWAAFQAEVQRQLMAAHMEERRRTRGDRAAARAKAAQLKVKIGAIEVDK